MNIKQKDNRKSFETIFVLGAIFLGVNLYKNIKLSKNTINDCIFLFQGSYNRIPKNFFGIFKEKLFILKIKMDFQT